MWNEPDEAALLRRWFDHMREVRPSVCVTYNDDFSIGFVETRAEKNSMSMYLDWVLGATEDRRMPLEERAAPDAFAWVKRDLPSRRVHGKR